MVGMQISPTTMGTSMEFPQKTRHVCVIWPSCATSGYLPKGLQLDPFRKMYTSEDHHISQNMSVLEGHILYVFSCLSL